ncbi:MAG: hypothetical protein ACREOO_09685 [bacterium]
MALDQGDCDHAAGLLEESFAMTKDRDPQMLWLMALVKQPEGEEQ